MERYQKKFSEKSPIKIIYQDGAGKNRPLKIIRNRDDEVELVLMDLPYPNNVISLSKKNVRILAKLIN